MKVKAEMTSGEVKEVFSDINSFKVSYDDNSCIHIKTSGDTFDIWSDDGLIGTDVSKYIVTKGKKKQVHITQPEEDIWEFKEV